MFHLRIVLLALISVFSYLSAEEICFSNMTLEDAERLVLQNNHDFLAMKQLVQIAKQGKLESLSKWMPEINFISSGYKTGRIQTGTNSRSAFISQFSLMQALFSTDRFYNLKIANLEAAYLEILLNSLAIDLLYAVREAYCRVILDRQNVQTARQNIKIFSDLAAQMESNYKIGTSILLSVNQSKVAIANSASVYYEAVRTLKVDMDKLAALLGYNPGSVELKIAEDEIPIETIPVLASKVSRVQQVFLEGGKLAEIYKPDFPKSEKALMQNLFSKFELKEWQQAALTYRPALYSKRVQVKMAGRQIQKSKGEYYPSVSLAANYGGYPTNIDYYPSSKLTNQNFDWAVGFSFDWLLYDGFGRAARINQAKYNKIAKCQEFEKSVQEAYRDVRREIFNIEEAVVNYVTTEGNVKLAEQTLELANKQLNIGYINVFDYQRVVDEYILAINRKNQARFNLILGYYGLKHASGIDLRDGKL